MTVLMDDEFEDGVSPAEAMTAPCTVYVWGILNGASVYLEIAPAGGEFTPVAGVRFDAPGNVVIDPVGDYQLRARLGNAVSNTVVRVEAIS